MFVALDVASTQPCTTALYAFSADPITFGHINVVERVSRTFPRVIVGIGRNPTKKYLFSLDARLSFARQALAHLSNVTVMPFQGMVVDFASEQGASIIVKGVRNAADFDYEQVHHLVGISQKAGIDTHVLFADPALAHVSSSAAKAIQLEHGFIHEYVPLVVKAALEEAVSGQVVLGVTGTAGAGKSTLCDQLVAAGKLRGIAVHNIDLDALGHAVLDATASPLNHATCDALIKRFGQQIAPDGTIDRKKLAACVFGNAEALADLNNIMNWPMMLALRKSIYGLRGAVLLNGALLAEAGWLPLCNNRVILVDAPLATRVARMADRGYSLADAEKRVAAQWSALQKHEAMDAAIAQNRFGQVWFWDTGRHPSTSDAEQLLENVLTDTASSLMNGPQSHADRHA
jgi:pantetheine-phosphate adenylyltransferase/dephospho-CoA kinase